MNLPHENADVAFEGFQRLEDLATAYWYSEVLFTSLELNIFGLLAGCPAGVDQLAAKTGYDADGLSRFLSALVALGLVVEYEGVFSNAPLASRYLTPGNGAYMGDFLLYRRYLSPHWQRLGPRIRGGSRANERPSDESSEQYGERTLAYVRALDLQARIKSAESIQYLKDLLGPPLRRVLDVGGGAGAWCRAFRKLWPDLLHCTFRASRYHPGPPGNSTRSPKHGKGS